MPARHSTTCPSVLWRSPAVRVESLVWCSPSNSVVGTQAVFSVPLRKDLFGE
uniref:Uncharacterized protein n=1 Tax=Zea mays TaxID=4577 RepID=B6TT82_MAIZE|nr:hypothetical protein [Zea mays]